MKKLFVLLITAALFAACEGPMGPMGPAGRDGRDGSVQKIVVDDIYVSPEAWNIYTVDGEFDHFYADIDMPEITNAIFTNGFYYTYWKYRDGQVLVQEGEGATIYLDRWDNGQYRQYSETIGCSYSVGSLRLTISRSDFYNGRPGETLYFRFVAFY